MRLIDADALRESLFESSQFDTYNDYSMVLDTIDLAPTIEAEPARKWISVEDRLPKKGEVVLAFGTRSASTGQFQGVGARPWFWYWNGNAIRRVAHWMPLPEPPQEEGE